MKLGVDWHEVRVSRRIYRDGNSEYFLNKTPCRLRDIQSLFADTGVARSAYSMMERSVPLCARCPLRADLRGRPPARA